MPLPRPAVGVLAVSFPVESILKTKGKRKLSRIFYSKVAVKIIPDQTDGLNTTVRVEMFRLSYKSDQMFRNLTPVISLLAC